jgi:hypothetical protein
VRKPGRLIFWIALFCLVLSSPGLRGQLSDEEKRRLFLQSREDIRPVPKATPTPSPKPTAVSKPAATPTPTPRPKASPKPTPEATPRPKPSATPEPETTPAPKPKSGDEDKGDFIPLPEEKAEPKKGEPARPTPTPTPTPEPVLIPKGKTPQGRPLDAPIKIEKSGLDDDQGYEPSQKSQFGGFFKRWRYLTPATRKAIDNAQVRRGRWKYIIVHNSGTRQGNAKVFDVYHRRVRKMQNGLAYHFVIGNGNSSGDGEIEIGARWTRQINGGHVASDYLNDISIGICLVGDLNRNVPTKAQLGALDELITYLRGRVGKIKGKSTIVKGHKEINPKPTDCPGDRFPLGWLHQKFGS